ncbi:MAG: GMC family oxidoreductase, partial [Methyloligellaceae bacterium]
AGTMAAHPWFPGIRKPFANSFGCRAVLLHPKSRGHITVQSPDPEMAPRIRQNFFAEPDDMDSLRAGLKRVRQILNQPHLGDIKGKEIAPGADVDGDGDLDAYIRDSCITVHHPCGTCRMGNDGDAVVGPDLKVRGVTGLRVVDASVMPDLVSGNINATVYMIAEKASELIKRD